MNYRTKIWLGLLLSLGVALSPRPVFGKIHQIQSLRQIPAESLTPGSWLVLDLDRVLIRGSLSTELTHFEAGIPEWLSQLNDQGIHSMALTHRDPKNAIELGGWLEALNYRFTVEERKAPPVPRIEPKRAEPVFHRGVYSVAQWRSKGETFSNWLRDQGYRPAKVIFVDDNLVNVVDVGNWLSKEGISFEVYWLADSSETIPCGVEIGVFE